MPVDADVAAAVAAAIAAAKSERAARVGGGRGRGVREDAIEVSGRGSLLRTCARVRGPGGSTLYFDVPLRLLA